MSNEPLNLFVSPAGNDGWQGTVAAPAADGTNGPFATLAGARDAIRRRRAGGQAGAVTVHVAAGVYELPETLRFTPEDGGTAAAPVRYVAADGAAPAISGGRRIAGWRETEHQGLRCWVADLPEVAAGRWNFTRLYVNDAPRSRPRLPKNGFHRFTGLAGFEDTGFDWSKGPTRASFAPGDIRRWHNWQDAELVTYQLWFDTHHRFKEIDEAAGVAHFHAHSLGSLKDERGEFARYFVENVFEALDQPGEWYLDRNAGRLFYLPLPGERLDTAVVVAPRLTELVRLQGDGTRRVEHLHFENLVFAHQHWELPPDCPGYIQAAWGVPGAIVLDGAGDCVFYGCTIAHVNGYGLETLAGSTRNTVAACSIRDTGAGGIKIGHEQLKRANDPTSAKAPLATEVPPMAMTVADCTIRDGGCIYPSAIGIWVGNSGWNTLLHNRIFNCNYTGISCGWIWGYAPSRTVANRIEYNHIHHINHREILSDNGGIYTLGQQPGTVLRGNLIHDISCYGYGAWGIYPDEGSSEMRVENNVVCGTKKASYSTHYGRDNLVQNNIFALSRDDHLCLGKRERHRSTLFRRNVVITANGQVRGGGWDPAHYTAQDNLFHSLDGSPFTFNGVPLVTLQAQGQNAGAIVADPLFADAAGGDFALRPDSPALATGFRPFDGRGAGPRLGAAKPRDFAAYLRRWALPDRNEPVIRTSIVPVNPAEAVAEGAPAEFVVKVTNVGQGRAEGVVRLAAGPKGKVGRPSVARFAYALAPGESREEPVTVKVRKGAGTFWLDSEPAGAAAVPARGLVLDPALLRWPVPRVKEAEGLRDAAATLGKMSARLIARGNRTLAEVVLAANEAGLLVLARMGESKMRPNLAEPWFGTGLELLAYHKPAPGTPVDRPEPRQQVFLVPREGGEGADGLRLDAARKAAVPAPELVVDARTVAGVCQLTAIVPWRLLGYERLPAEVPAEVIINSIDPATNEVVQQVAFDPVSDGWRNVHGCLVIGA